MPDQTQQQMTNQMLDRNRLAQRPAPGGVTQRPAPGGASAPMAPGPPPPSMGPSWGPGGGAMPPPIARPMPWQGGSRWDQLQSQGLQDLQGRGAGPSIYQPAQGTPGQPGYQPGMSSMDYRMPPGNSVLGQIAAQRDNAAPGYQMQGLSNGQDIYNAQPPLGGGPGAPQPPVQGPLPPSPGDPMAPTGPGGPPGGPPGKAGGPGQPPPPPAQPPGGGGGKGGGPGGPGMPPPGPPPVAPGPQIPGMP